ncbi:hypothetical protein EDC04DRAFT_3086226 [Pisolithus marmoratus]|nr:hypothetical protein EDC04DRAFT_3086226 [Pisolithus marmoratus]
MYTQEFSGTTYCLVVAGTDLVSCRTRDSTTCAGIAHLESALNRANIVVGWLLVDGSWLGYIPLSPSDGRGDVRTRFADRSSYITKHLLRYTDGNSDGESVLSKRTEEMLLVIAVAADRVEPAGSAILHNLESLLPRNNDHSAVPSRSRLSLPSSTRVGSSGRRRSLIDVSIGAADALQRYMTRTKLTRLTCHSWCTCAKLRTTQASIEIVPESAVDVKRITSPSSFCRHCGVRCTAHPPLPLRQSGKSRDRVAMSPSHATWTIQAVAPRNLSPCTMPGTYFLQKHSCHAWWQFYDHRDL